MTRQGTGEVIAGGSWAGAGVVQHQVHAVGGAAAEAEGGKLQLPVQAWGRVGSGCNKLAGVEQPEGGGSVWRVVKRV